MFSIGLYSVQMQVHHYWLWSIVRRFQEHHLKSNTTNSAYILVKNMKKLYKRAK